MSNYGATAIGFVIKEQEQIKADLISLAQDPICFGPDEDVSAYAPLGMFIELVSRSYSEIWQAVESNYNESYLETATGISLDRLVRLKGIKRKKLKQKKSIL
ncbi:hypothetical protein LEP1GSC115_0396 [Leptospira interrogans serovar Australis str. 200703203]|uniref:Uncharacterized protein n=1 Tax=Leptospira interrogans serovar Australis str. 200703203 TaxID=1085541 RepID=N1UGR3_LEPIR|nr:hypothetical protein LEP1GSC115_0396 [Leptospira interrogans serovar Australis str. 200703203]